ncbi:MAG: protein kinase domain-containing protein, partial [Planctomycetota bacterium]
MSERGSGRSDRPERDKGDTQADAKADTQKVALHRQPVREFGRYEILEEVSRGAMGIVYRAREKALGRIVALKVLLAGEHASDEQVGRFIREARAIARIRHPNIVPIHDVGEVDGRHYFTMDYIEGDPLSRMIEKGKVDIRRALDIVESIADAAECAHAAGVVHRDIKPSNIMIDAEGRAQITDFGLAKPVEGDTQYTRTGTTIGTPAYMPPEQAKGDVAAITPQSDIYSIGAVLYELVTGVAPFEGPSMLDIILDVLHNEPARPRKLNPRVHADVETIILRAMEKDAERRYASAAEFRDDIRRFKAGEAIHAHPPSVLRHVSRWSRRHVMLVVWVATVLLGGGVFALVVRHMAARVPTEKTTVTKAPPRPYWNLVWEDPAPRGGKDTGWEERAGFLDGRELVPAGREASLGSVRITATVEFAPDAKKLEIAVGLLGTQDRDNPIPFYGVIGGGKITLHGVPDIEQSAVNRRTQRDMRVLIERQAPPLRAGARYSVKFERRDLDIVFEVASEDGEFDETLVVRNMHLSNWRAKHLFPVLGLRAGAKWGAFRLDELYGGSQDAFDDADGKFVLGEYGGAERRFKAIVETGRPASRVNAARLRLGMCSEIRRRIEDAVRWYDSVEESAAEPIPAIEAKLRQPFCLLALRQPEEAERAVTELAARSRAFPEAWRRHGPAWKWQLADLADALAGAKRYPAAAGVIGLARPPAGWPRMERAAARAANGLADEARADDLLALARACPSADLAP